MPQSLFTFMLSELAVVRLICQAEDCKAVMELTVGQLAKAEKCLCPLCRKPLGYSDDDSHARLVQLAVAIENARQPAVAKRVAVQFVLPGQK